MNLREFSVRDWVHLAVRVFLGGFYIAAGAVKLPDPGKFAEAIGNYRILPHEWLNLAAITLPGIEIVAGAFLVLGVWLRTSAWMINAMTALFIVAIATALAQGLNIECGCFGTVGGREVGLLAIFQDLLLLAAGVWLVWPGSRQRKVATAPEMAAPTPENGQPGLCK
ncbi:MAG: DoxX family protein [Verrucomicrobiia bacterium]